MSRTLQPKNNVVVKANELIQKSRFSLSVQQQKIVLYLVSRINPMDQEFELYDFSIPEFCRICGIDPTNGKNYMDLKAAIKAIADKSLWIRLENGKETLVRWIEKPYIDEGSGLVQIRLDKDMKPYLLQLKANFTKYELIWTLNFKSKYAIRMYELVKSYHYQEMERYERVFELDELRRALDAEQYTVFQDFKKRVLIPSVEEINETSDKLVSWEPIKRGRSVGKILLSIETKEPLARLKAREKIEERYNLRQISLWEK